MADVPLDDVRSKLKRLHNRYFQSGKPQQATANNCQSTQSVANVPQSRSAEPLGSNEAPAQFGNKQNRASLRQYSPRKEEMILKSIEQVYYNDDPEFNAGLHELESLPDHVDAAKIQKDKRRRKEQLNIVNKKISALIVENHPSYSAELKRVAELQQMLDDTLVSCLHARKCLDGLEKRTSGGALDLLAKHRRHERLHRLHKCLQTVKTLQETDARLRQLLEDGDFASAITLCVECRQAAQSFTHFSCISDMSVKFAETLAQIECHLDEAITPALLDFDTERYARTLNAFELLKKTNVLSDRVHMRALDAVNTSAVGLLGKVLGEQQAFNDAQTQLHEQFRTLCARLPAESVSACVRQLCRVLWRILFHCHCIVRHHAALAQPADTTLEGDEWREPGACASTAQCGGKAELDIPLEAQLTELWETACDKIDVLLRSVDSTLCKFDDFMEIVEIVSGWVQVGLVHFMSPSGRLSATAADVARNFFHQYHSARVEETRTFLDNELWHPCPMHVGWTVFELPELSFLKAGEPSPSRSASGGDATNAAAQGGRYKLMRADLDCPFDDTPAARRRRRSDRVASSASGALSDDEDEQLLRRDCVEDDATSATTSPTESAVYVRLETQPPVVCNSALNLLRLFGRYLRIMHLLPAVAFDIVTGISQLFDFLLVAVYESWGGLDGHHFIVVTDLMSERLLASLKRIQTATGKSIQASAAPVDSAAVSRGDHWCMRQRTVAVESLIFVSEQLSELVPHLSAALPRAKAAFVQQFYSQDVSPCVDMRRCVYGGAAAAALDWRAVAQAVAGTNWAVAELQSQHSRYVDHVTAELTEVQRKMDEMTRVERISTLAYDEFWWTLILCVCHALIEGYSSPGRKCTESGRALMQLDALQLAKRIEAVTLCRPPPHHHLVQNYVRAFYLPEGDIEHWVEANTRPKGPYSAKQVSALLNAASHISKKTRQKLLQAFGAATTA